MGPCRGWIWTTVSVAASLGLACGSPAREDGAFADEELPDSGQGAEPTSTGGNENTDSQARLDVGSEVESGGVVDECEVPDHVPCDQSGSDPFAAMGVGCAGEAEIVSSMSGPAGAITVMSSFGETSMFSPREGSAYAVIGTGVTKELDEETPIGDPNLTPGYCNDDIGPFDVGADLPFPLRAQDVAGNCEARPSLVGTGDCSNTIQEQFDLGLHPLGSQPGANDYVELRFEVDVPRTVSSLSYDFAFFSTEYPFYYPSNFNDMYVGWLESEDWTGNISFDDEGNPISLNAGFLALRDDDGDLPELAGTCMRQHASTGWLRTTASVNPGEHITLVFAIFDVGDSLLDSYVFLDNFSWGCDGGPPVTIPEG